VTPTAPPGSVAGRTVAYTNLSADQRAAFDAALDGPVTFVPNTSYVDGTYHHEDARALRQYDVVRKNGTGYRLSWSSGELYAQYGIRANPAADASESDVVAFANLSNRVREQVRSAVVNGIHTVPYGKWDSLPPALDGTEHVRYEGETYGLTYLVGDYWAEILSVEPVDGDTNAASPTPTGGS
jgi:hypothetical protein